MQAMLVCKDHDRSIYTAWHGFLQFTFIRYKDDTPDTMTIWDHTRNVLLSEMEIPKLTQKEIDWMNR